MTNTVNSGTTALLTDHYELTMLQAALRSGAASRRAVFEVFARHLPHGRRYGVVAGTGRLLDALERFRFGPDELSFLRENQIVDEATLQYLSSYRFSGNIWGYAEGDMYFPGSPILVVEGTFAESVLLETVVLSILNHDCAVASAASRMVTAAGGPGPSGRPLIEMGSRRTHEWAAVAAARAAYIAGFASTSNLQARFTYGVPSSGTSAHAFTLVHDSERDAFAAQLTSLGPGTTLLVDTFNVEQAVRAAVEVAGPSLGAVRIDSGDLPALAVSVRALLDSLGATPHADHPHRGPRRVLDRRARRRPRRRVRRGDLARHRVRGADRRARLQAGGAVGRAGGGRRGVRYRALRPVAKRSVGKPGRGGRKWAVRERSAAGEAATERILLAPPADLGPGRPRAAAGTRPRRQGHRTRAAGRGAGAAHGGARRTALVRRCSCPAATRRSPRSSAPTARRLRQRGCRGSSPRIR